MERLSSRDRARIIELTGQRASFTDRIDALLEKHNAQLKTGTSTGFVPTMSASSSVDPTSQTRQILSEKNRPISLTLPLPTGHALNTQSDAQGASKEHGDDDLRQGRHKTDRDGPESWPTPRDRWRSEIRDSQGSKKLNLADVQASVCRAEIHTYLTSRKQEQQANRMPLAWWTRST